MPLSTTSSSTLTAATAATARPPTSGEHYPPPPSSSRRIPVTPAVLRGIFASSRTLLEERSLSRVAFFRFTGFILSCLTISLLAARNRGIKAGAGLLGVGVV